MSLKDFTALVPVERNKYRVGRSITCTVDARKVWEALEVKARFNDWITRRIKKYGFKQGRDFCVYKPEFYSDLSKTSNGGRPPIEYHVTLDMAKELGMIENTALGHEIRQYFIRAEEELRKIQIARAKTIPVHKELAKAIQEYKSWVRTINPDSAYVTRPGAPFDTFQRMIYKPLFNLDKVPDNFRERLSRDNLDRLKTVEHAVMGFIRQEMSRHGTDYKAVFFAVRNRASAMIEIVGPADLSGNALPDALFR